MLSYSALRFIQKATNRDLGFCGNFPGLRKNHLVLKNNLDGDDADKNVLHQRANALNVE